MIEPEKVAQSFAVALLGLKFLHRGGGTSRCELQVRPELFNPNGVVHGGVIYSLADTGMGGALHAVLDPGELCATIEIKIVYLKAVTAGLLECETRIVRKGRRIAVLESDVRVGDDLVAKALGTFSIFKPR